MGSQNMPRVRAVVYVKTEYSLPRSNGHTSNKLHRKTGMKPKLPLAPNLPENNCNSLSPHSESWNVESGGFFNLINEYFPISCLRHNARASCNSESEIMKLKKKMLTARRHRKDRPLQTFQMKKAKPGEVK